MRIPPSCGIHAPGNKTVFSAPTNAHSRLQMPPQNTPSAFFSLAHPLARARALSLIFCQSLSPLPTPLSPSLWRSHGSAMRA